VRVLEDPGRTTVALVGCGGTGGIVLKELCRLLYGLKEARRGATEPLFGGPEPDGVPPLVVIDGDSVERKNLLRQNFVPADVRGKKATVLASRYAAAFGLEVSAYPRYLNADTRLPNLIPDRSVVVGCVDNAATRALLHDKLSDYHNVVYVDSGNGGVELPEGGGHPTRAERKRLRDSGWSGQVLCGVRKDGETILALPADRHPDLLAPGDEHHPEEVPCGQVVATLPQRHLTNLLAATVVMGFLTPLLADGTILHAEAFFDARRGYVASYPALDEMEEVAA
jgi:hypothetical protein